MNPTIAPQTEHEKPTIGSKMYASGEEARVGDLVNGGGGESEVGRPLSDRYGLLLHIPGFGVAQVFRADLLRSAETVERIE
jgi:hypothetical protein